MFRVIIL